MELDLNASFGGGLKESVCWIIGQALTSHSLRTAATAGSSKDLLALCCAFWAGWLFSIPLMLLGVSCIAHRTSSGIDHD